MTRLSQNTITNLEELRNEIIKNFPIGREAGYLLDAKGLQYNDYEEALNSILHKGGSDKKYTDDNSRAIARDLLNVLRKLKPLGELKKVKVLDQFTSSGYTDTSEPFKERKHYLVTLEFFSGHNKPFFIIFEHEIPEIEKFLRQEGIAGHRYLLMWLQANKQDFYNSVFNETNIAISVKILEALQEHLNINTPKTQ
ncbi:MAG: hypothetical protein JSS63_03625 [Bacteroidetes bacterium]|nr:hypothetical protein [Bacteroidota bacterium]